VEEPERFTALVVKASPTSNIHQLLTEKQLENNFQKPQNEPRKAAETSRNLQIYLDKQQTPPTFCGLSSPASPSVCL
jgi:hypothetical protein